MQESKLKEQQTINSLQANWVWVPNWIDSSPINTAGRLVRFKRKFTLTSAPENALLHFSADTRYKLLVNGVHVATGPARGSPSIWYYDSLDIAAQLRIGQNEVEFLVLRYFASSRGAMPFERTSFPGLTVVGCAQTATEIANLESRQHWEAQVDESVRFPTGLVDDVFLHVSYPPCIHSPCLICLKINERVDLIEPSPIVVPVPYEIRSVNGELPPWRLRPRVIPMPETQNVAMDTIKLCKSNVPKENWTGVFSRNDPLTLFPGSTHVLELQADVHSTAFLQCVFKAVDQPSQVKLKITYSEGYELEPRSYPYFRSKGDRLDNTAGVIIGPYDEATLTVPDGEDVVYEPFWFRTFRVLRIEITIAYEPVVLLSFRGTQVNYPLGVRASWRNLSEPDSEDIWNVSIRTLRNCMFDGYSDCPFYEQLQYSGDSRSVGLFHYLLSGDDRLMRQAITNFASSITPEGLTQSRFPSHVPQIIAGFPLYWILQICDHYLFFGDIKYSRSFVPRIDGVLDFFDSHIDELGLVSGISDDVWQYVDWVSTWGATDEHPDKGVPVSGRKSNRHTYFSMLYAYVLRHAARLLREVGRPGNADEYDSRADAVVSAIRKHCYNGEFFTDSTADVAGPDGYSQHCQVFAVLSGAAFPADHQRILAESFENPKFSKCSYVMRFYLLRALSIAGGGLYEGLWVKMWKPWRAMLGNNLSTWEEDDVRQRSDCHAWGSVPLYEYCTELAGVSPIAPRCSKILFKPRLSLSDKLSASIVLGPDNSASVEWYIENDGQLTVKLTLQRAISVVSQLPGQELKEHGVVSYVELHYTRAICKV
ncbi:hypothetical protein N7466_010345 [Penicillium verhagenii]|uniref:uncharacterized protein n=1 Tax=Penicillium verhagenii TaxID=1562060 RepID=UPI002544F56A|nr:uncharacterized protein N7466_010345 [Penicillium verhagenii]KAJ5919402.1 hypothetical protein N7466_010345 [Penicillium verhagenii]